MPSDSIFKILNSAHRFVLRASGGRLGWRLIGMEVVELTTTGRKSGERRSVLLTSPIQDDDSVVLVASKGGDTKHPAWFLNLRDDPRVMLSRRGRPAIPMRARIAASEERSALWARAVKKYKPYAGYQERAGREIPLVVVEPVDR